MRRDKYKGATLIGILLDCGYDVAALGYRERVEIGLGEKAWRAFEEDVRKMAPKFDGDSLSVTLKAANGPIVVKMYKGAFQ